MKRRIFALFVLVIFIFSQSAVVDARSFGRSFGGGHSFSSKSFSSKSWSSSRSRSWSGSSSSKSGLWGSSSSSSKKSSSSGSSGYSKGSSGSSGSGYSGSSSSRRTPGSYSSKATAGTSRTNTKKNAYMQDTYKKQASSFNYSKYKQKLNTDQQKAYDSAMKSNVYSRSRMNLEDSLRTKASRVNSFNTRRVYVNINPVYFGSPFSYGYAHVGIWDLWFLMRASDLFWYHHWHEITPYRDYFEASQYASMEARVQRLEQQYNGVRDTTYMDEGVDPDLQLSDEYQKAHPDSVYDTNKYSSPAANPVAVIIIIALAACILIIILKRVSRAKPRKTYNSRIY